MDRRALFRVEKLRQRGSHGPPGATRIYGVGERGAGAVCCCVDVLTGPRQRVDRAFGALEADLAHGATVAEQTAGGAVRQLCHERAVLEDRWCAGCFGQGLESRLLCRPMAQERPRRIVAQLYAPALRRSEHPIPKARIGGAIEESRGLQIEDVVADEGGDSPYSHSEGPKTETAMGGDV